jgi:hypothetical protein
MDIILLALSGDFDAALAAARRITQDPSAKPASMLQASIFAADVLEESGRVADARAEREATVRASAAWGSIPQVRTVGGWQATLEVPWSLAMLEVHVAHDTWLYETHDRAAYLRARDAAMARLPSEYAPGLYCAPLLEKEDGVDLLTAAAAKPGAFGPSCIGEARLVTGDAAGAAQALSESLRLCGRNGDMETPRLRALLGEALEQTGDTAGARREYERVLRAWGNAKPGSVTAERVRSRLAKLPAAP